MSDTAAESKVSDEKPTEGKLADSQPAAAAAAESEPVDAGVAPSAAATAADGKPGETASADAKPGEAASGEAKSVDVKSGAAKPDAKPAATARPMRRPASASATRRAPGAGDAAKAPPAPPSKIKTGMLVACVALALACVGMGIYLYTHPKTPPPTKAAIDRLDEKAKDFAVKLEKAVALYQDGQAKAASEKLEEMTEADVKLTEASGLFNDIVESGQTIEIDDIKQKVQIARDKHLSIDTDLLALRKRIDKIDTEKGHDRPKTTQASKPADTTPLPATPPPAAIGKEPTKEELSDENLNKLFDNDPSEYDRLAKYREKINPNFKAKKP